MIKPSANHAAVSADHVSMPGKNLPSETDDFSGAFNLAHGEADTPQADRHSLAGDYVADNADHNVHGAGNVDSSVGDHTIGTLVSIETVIEDSVNGTASADHLPSLTSSGTSFADLIVSPISGSDLNSDQLSGVFDHVENLTAGSSGFTTADTTYPGQSFDSPESYHPIDLPDFISDAKGGGHSGGGGSHGGGGTTPAAYTTNSGTGVDIHITYDSSVGNAPSGFTSVVQHVADFFASSFIDPTQHITINIDVGFGEVDGMRLGSGALGESVTNLQGVSYAQLHSAYAGSYLSDVSLGASPGVGNLYVSFAEAKALNIAVPNTIDGYIGFSSQSGIFDYNNADGVSSGQYDFYGVVAHELSEVMGRLLLVGATINNAASYMAYDLFHYNNGVQDFAGNGGYFSTNGGGTVLAYFNNASNGGDAGDWASSGTSGSPVQGSVSGSVNGSTYDAFNAFGTSGHVAPVTNTDLWALHAAGFDLAHPITA